MKKTLLFWMNKIFWDQKENPKYIELNNMIGSAFSKALIGSEKIEPSVLQIQKQVYKKLAMANFEFHLSWIVMVTLGLIWPLLPKMANIPLIFSFALLAVSACVMTHYATKSTKLEREL